MTDSERSEDITARPVVSVVMATYNGARYISDQLASIAAQTLLPDELVVSDDGSRDATLDMVRAFAQTAPFAVRILDKPERLGFADNFLFAIEACRGDVVALADQDDAWMPAKLEIGVQRLIADGSLLSLHQLTLTDEALNPVGPWNQGIVSNVAYEPLTLDPWSGWGNTMVLRRELALLVPRTLRPAQPMEDRPLSHDTWLYILAAATGRVSHIAEPLILYRQHGRNAMGMERLSVTKRIASAIKVPLFSYRERDRFFGELAVIFEGMAADMQGEAAVRARAAAQRYRSRRDWAAMRVRLHTASTLAERLRAFVWLHGHRADDDRGGTATRLLSAAKDLGLGVTGWGSHA